MIQIEEVWKLKDELQKLEFELAMGISNLDQAVIAIVAIRNILVTVVKHFDEESIKQ